MPELHGKLILDPAGFITRGAYGRVRKAIWKRPSLPDVHVAVKYLTDDYIPSNATAAEKQARIHTVSPSYIVASNYLLYSSLIIRH